MHPPDQKLWYAEPATKFTEALPVGNGRLGAMVFGGTQQERLLLNENSVWSGNRSHYDRVSAYQWLPEVRRLLFAGKHEEAAQLVDREILGERPLGCYQPLGALALLFEHRGPATDYRRELDLDCAVARVQFRVGDASFTREVFASAPDQVLVVRLTCDQPGRISFIASLSRVEHASLSTLGKDTLVLRGQTDHGQPTAGVKFEARVKTLVEGGVVHATAAGCRVEQADAVTLLLAAATDDGKMEPAELCARHLAAAAIKTYAELREAHLADYRKLYRRVSLDLGNSTSGSLPTDQRLLQPDPSLAALYFQYGRYLLISSSRPGHLPANLQGLWNDQLQPACRHMSAFLGTRSLPWRPGVPGPTRLSFDEGGRGVFSRLAGPRSRHRQTRQRPVPVARKLFCGPGRFRAVAVHGTGHGPADHCRVVRQLPGCRRLARHG
ncbi:MAG: glycoside hydrolase family 95 protein [Betaproteobacteria bacterium]|nr:glycoside hydrolase family 95 protein [Betaproteobacteria bacterium]